ncbi:collagen alpha-2(I) chain-like [Palaemon carinicauda]|uniref:collagen alpha-2(I) chain-like n=1 Tax=Palaemon carinicauda TaxID=392227 RepID=UPI0035B5DB85
MGMGGIRGRTTVWSVQSVEVGVILGGRDRGRPCHSTAGRGRWRSPAREPESTPSRRCAAASGGRLLVDPGHVQTPAKSGARGRQLVDPGGADRDGDAAGPARPDGHSYTPLGGEGPPVDPGHAPRRAEAGGGRGARERESAPSRRCAAASGGRLLVDPGHVQTPAKSGARGRQLVDPGGADRDGDAAGPARPDGHSYTPLGGEGPPVDPGHGETAAKSQEPRSSTAGRGRWRSRARERESTPSRRCAAASGGRLLVDPGHVQAPAKSGARGRQLVDPGGADRDGDAPVAVRPDGHSYTPLGGEGPPVDPGHGETPAESHARGRQAVDPGGPTEERSRAEVGRVRGRPRGASPPAAHHPRSAGRPVRRSEEEGRARAGTPGGRPTGARAATPGTGTRRATGPARRGPPPRLPNHRSPDPVPARSGRAAPAVNGEEAGTEEAGRADRGSRALPPPTPTTTPAVGGRGREGGRRTEGRTAPDAHAPPGPPARQKDREAPAFTVCIRTENQDQASFCPSAPREVSVLPELALGHLRYRLTGVPPQSNSPPGTVPGAGRARPARGRALGARSESPSGLAPPASPDDEAFGYLKRVIVTPAVYPRFIEFLHFDIQSTGQKSHRVNTRRGPSRCFVLIKQSDSPGPHQF